MRIGHKNTGSTLDALEREQALSASLAASVAALTEELAALRTAKRRRWWQRR